MAAVQAAENHGDEWGLTWYFSWGIYTSVPTWTHLQNSLAAAEHWVKDPNKHKNSHKQCDERGISCCEYDRKSMETVTTKCSEFPNGGKAVAEQILASEEINKSKTAELWELQSGILKMTSQVWQSQKRIHINTNHSYHQPP